MTTLHTKKLAIVRHGKAASPNRKLSDYDRPLQAKGEEQVLACSQKIQKYGTPHRILCSAALRTLSTAEILASELGYPREQIDAYDTLHNAPAEAWLQTIGNYHKEHDYLLIVGHNPGMSDLVQYLSGDYGAYLGTGEHKVLECALDAWEGLSKQSASILS